MVVILWTPFDEVGRDIDITICNKIGDQWKIPTNPKGKLWEMGVEMKWNESNKSSKTFLEKRRTMSNRGDWASISFCFRMSTCNIITCACIISCVLWTSIVCFQNLTNYTGTYSLTISSHKGMQNLWAITMSPRFNFHMLQFIFPI